ERPSAAAWRTSSSGPVRGWPSSRRRSTVMLRTELESEPRIDQDAGDEGRTAAVALGDVVSGVTGRRQAEDLAVAVRQVTDRGQQLAELCTALRLRRRGVDGHVHQRVAGLLADRRLQGTRG